MRLLPTKQLRNVLRFSYFNGRRSPEQARQEAMLPPGTMIYIGADRAERAETSIFAYNQQQYEEHRDVSAEQLPEYLMGDEVNWVNVDGIHDVKMVNDLAEIFSIHPLTKEDIVNTAQLPKIEMYDDYLYLTCKMLSVKDQTGKIDLEQISLVLGPSFVLSLQEKTEDILESIRERIRTARGQVRRQQADYLFYAILDVIVSNYIIVISHLTRQVDELEEEMTGYTHHGQLAQIRDFRKTLLHLRRYIAPLREQNLALQKSMSPLIRKKVLPYFQDLGDLLNQAISEIDTYRDILSSMSDQYLALASHKMNEIMKVLTIVATIFIPITFIAGIYGMNFDHMPELHWKHGYAFAWALMGAMTLGMLGFFRWKRWL